MSSSVHYGSIFDRFDSPPISSGSNTSGSTSLTSTMRLPYPNNQSFGALLTDSSPLREEPSNLHLSMGAHDFRNERSRQLPNTVSPSQISRGSNVSMDSRITAYIMQLERELEESKGQVMALQLQNQESSARFDALLNNFTTLSSTLANHTANFSAPSLSSTLANTTMQPLNSSPAITTHPTPNIELNSANYPSVRFWTKRQYLAHVKSTQGVTNLNDIDDPEQDQPSMRGPGRLAQGINVSCKYMENAHGLPVDGFRAQDMRNVVASFFHQLNNAKISLPDKWQLVPLNIKTEYYATMRAHFEEFQYCGNNWKAEYIAGKGYPQWHRYHYLKRKNAVAVKQEGVAASEPTESTALPDISADVPSVSIPSKRPLPRPVLSSNTTTPDSEATTAPKKQKIDTVEAPQPSTLIPVLNPNTISPIASKSLSSAPLEPLTSDSEDEPDVEVLPASSDPSSIGSVAASSPASTATQDNDDNDATTIPTSTGGFSAIEKGKGKEIIVPVVKNPLKIRIMGVSGSFHASVVSKPPTGTPLGPIAPSPTLPIVTSLVISDPVPPPAPVIAEGSAESSIIDSADSEKRPKRAAAIAQTASSVPAPSVKGKQWRVPATINAKNLCATARIAAGFPVGTYTQFTSYWKKLPAEDKAVFEAKAKKTLAASAAAASNDNIDHSGAE